VSAHAPWRVRPEPAIARRERLYFLHIPKTAGITVGRFLQNHYSFSDTLRIDEWKARELPPHEVSRHSLFSGHYSSEVLEAMGPRPVIVTLVRDALGRFDSWSAHCRRVSHRKYRDMFEGRTDLEVLEGPYGYTCRQAHWLARALATGADDTSVPASTDLPDLLNGVDLVGITSEVERFMQLVSFHMGWPPPPRDWHVNQRPVKQDEPVETPRPQAEEQEIRRLLAIDAELHELATHRFWASYARMLDALSPEGTTFTTSSAAAVPLDTVQGWLRARYLDEVAATFPRPVTDVEVSSDDALCGEGWWWRSGWPTLDDRWTGPESRSSWYLPRLAQGRSYELTIEVLASAGRAVWDGAAIEVNGVGLPVVRHHSAPAVERGAPLRLTATLSPEVVSRQRGLTRVVVEVPETLQHLKHMMVCESFDTYHPDLRRVGLSVQRLTIHQA
jgi:hypothetical protein